MTHFGKLIAAETEKWAKEIRYANAVRRPLWVICVG
jgi:hypothetical protein